MQMVGEQLISAPVQRVWEALNDPEVLRASIPGCQTLDKESDERFTAIVEIKVGPIGARFKGAVTLTDLNPPNSYTLLLEGNGGIAGSAKGSAKVRLAEQGGNTLITYEVDAQVGGRMAQLGGPIIDATAKQLAAKFFGRFGEIVSGVKPATSQAAAPTASSASTPTTAATTAAQTATAPQAAPAASGGSSLWPGIAVGLLIVIVAAAAFQFGRSSSAPVIVLDDALLKQIMSQTNREDK